MVALRVTFSMNVPFAVEGRALTTASMTATPFSESAVGSKENLPTGTATLPFLSSLNSTRPALTSLIAFAVSSVTVPVLRVGHKAARAEDLAELADFRHGGGSGDGDVEILEAFLALLNQVFKADVLSTRLLGGGRGGAGGENEDPDALAGAVGKRTGAADHLV